MTRLGAVTGWLALLLAVTGSDASAELIERTADGTTNLYTWAFDGVATSGIRSFLMQYVDRDHFVSHLGLGPLAGPWRTVNSRFMLQMNGKFAREKIRGGVSLWNWAEESPEVFMVSGRCRGSCSIPIRPVPADRVLLLTGFRLDFGWGNDHQIEFVQVRPLPERNLIRVGFGHGTATGGYDAYVTYMTLPVTAFAAYSPTDPRYRSPYRTFVSQRFTNSLSAGRELGSAYLRGFSLTFLNGVQNLLAIKIDLSRGIDVQYTGNYPGQPATAVVDYVLHQVRWFY